MDKNRRFYEKCIVTLVWKKEQKTETRTRQKVPDIERSGSTTLLASIQFRDRTVNINTDKLRKIWTNIQDTSFKISSLFQRKGKTDVSNVYQCDIFSTQKTDKQKFTVALKNVSWEGLWIQAFADLLRKLEQKYKLCYEKLIVFIGFGSDMKSRI